MTNDLRSYLAKARDKWLESEKGLECQNGKAEGEFLRNRLEASFLVGSQVYRDLFIEAKKLLMNIGIIELTKETCDASKYQKAKEMYLARLNDFLSKISNERID